MTTGADDWKERAFEAFAESLARQQALTLQQRSERGEFSIELVRAEEDSPVGDAAFQSDLRVVNKALRDAQVPFAQTAIAMDSISAHGYPLPEFILAIKVLGPTAISAIGVAVGAWMQGRYGRKARLKIGDVEAEARTVAEVEELLKRAAEFRANDTK